MKNFKLIIQYDGAAYKGWQRLKDNDKTIQGKLEDTLSRFLNQRVTIDGSGRTDAGVHALAQVASFTIDETKIEHKKEYGAYIMEELNKYLPLDIRVLDCREADLRFHARLNAKSKIYEYRIDNSKIAKVFERKYLTRIEQSLDLELMRRAAELLVGTHDFQGFSTSSSKKKSSVRTIYSIDITDKEGIVYIRYHGNGFLYNMVRIMTGMLVDIGLHKESLEAIPLILESKDRSMARGKAPAAGLFLIEVKY